MKGFNGKVCFYKQIKHNYMTVFSLEKDEDPVVAMGEDYLYLDVSIDVDVTFPDTRQQEIESWQKQIEAERAESQHKINIMLGKIQNLQALEHD